MKTLKQNVLKGYGEKGQRWIVSLPMIISELVSFWELSQMTPVDNMSFNYVTKAMTSTHQPVILKISCDEKAIADEVRALKYFNGSGSIQLIAYDSTYHALLLQQAVPGITLKSLYPSQMEYVMDCYIGTMKKLHHQLLPKQHDYKHISDWLTAIDNLTDQSCPSHLLRKAITLKNELLASMTTQVFLHGDLHHDNVLQHQDEWLAIDPKGIVGEPEFEIAAFDFMHVNELSNKNDVKNILENRVNLLAQKANLNPRRIQDWLFVRLILMAAWQVEDHEDPSGAIKLAEALIMIGKG